MSASFSRRRFLHTAGSLLVLAGASPLDAARTRKKVVTPYAQGEWLWGDHHIHTKYSSDGCYEILSQVQAAAQNGLGFCVITDHGGPAHAKVVAKRAHEELVAARKACPQIVVFQGLEWNIPQGEHGSVILPPTDDEARLVAEFEQRFDGKGKTLGEADAVSGVGFLQRLPHKPLFFANHPARRGIDSPHELRAWRDAGPDVMRGFEGAPGHAASTLVGQPRGHYLGKPEAASFPGYSPASYFTHGGYDYYTAQVGGVWDSLLAEGKPFYITCNSDSHHYYGDLHRYDRRKYQQTGEVTKGDQHGVLPGASRRDIDYPPGVYTGTRVFADSRDPLAVLAAMRCGNMFTCLGGFVDSLSCYVHDGERAVPMGGYLRLLRSGAPVELLVELELSKNRNLGGVLPSLHHMDLIIGEILPPLKDPDAQTHPTARILRRILPTDCERRGSRLVFRHTFRRVTRSFYLRLRGTNTPVLHPQPDPKPGPDFDPWNDLWFYGNPIFVMLPG